MPNFDTLDNYQFFGLIGILGITLIALIHLLMSRYSNRVRDKVDIEQIIQEKGLRELQIKGKKIRRLKI